jgi:hypothetical protein
MSEQPAKKKCKQPDGPDGYHKFCMNTDHDGKAILEAMWKFYLEEAGDNCGAVKMLSDDARQGARFRKFGEKPKGVDLVLGMIPGTTIVEEKEANGTRD